ncbi:MAG: glycogen/starch synthase [Patescibacteria group bacterium]|nr:glycogen/starch synthase [Patescibacteria group bacterium]MDD5172784.1 glycogen/starch synthase [Patescibacteria group bacterium]
MKILFVASEVNPIIKVGGIADVVGSLSKEIKKFGQDVRIVIPFYRILRGRKFLKKALFKIQIDGKGETVEVFQTFLPRIGGRSKISVYLIKNSHYLIEKGVYLDTRKFLHLSRFLFFSKAVTEMFPAINWTPEIIHCHDWHAGAIPLFLKVNQNQIHLTGRGKLILNKEDLKIKKIKTLFTIHNLLTQGYWNHSRVIEFLGLKGDEAPSLFEKSSGPYGDNFNVVQQAILNADLINAVSPTYAKEIKTNSYYARGLDQTIKKRKKDIFGILNGIEIKLFNPSTDKYIKKNYSLKTINLKEINKTELQKEAGLEKNLKIPLLAVISRLDVQKGIDLIYKSANQILKKGAQIVFLGQGDKKYEEALLKIARNYPGRMSVYIKFDAELAQRIYAGADIFLMPSRFEPCGLVQLIAMRYGTIPVVRETGGLKDTVEKAKVTKGKIVRGTGFVFKKYSSQAFLNSINQALSFYKQPNIWRQLQKNAMKRDFSWKKSAGEYLKIYKKLLK